MQEYRRRKERIIAFLGGQCALCGATENLQIDHKDHTNKSFTVSSRWAYKWSELIIELKKCQLLCAEHHLEKSRAEGSLSKGWTCKPHWSHGTVWGYAKHHCRCDLCRSAKSIEGRKYRERKKNIGSRQP